MTLPKVLDEISYIANATNFRLALMNNFRHQDWDVSEKIAEDWDVCMTYRGYLKFLQTDLAQVFPVSDTFTKSKFKRGMEDIAKQMLIRGQVRQTNHTVSTHETFYTNGKSRPSPGRFAKSSLTTSVYPSTPLPARKRSPLAHCPPTIATPPRGTVLLPQGWTAPSPQACPRLSPTTPSMSLSWRMGGRRIIVRSLTYSTGTPVLSAAARYTLVGW